MNNVFKVSEKSYFIPNLMCLCNVNENEFVPEYDYVSEILQNHNVAIDKQTYSKKNKFQTYFPLHIDIFPTYECNLRCRYCYSGTGDYVPRSLNKKQIDKTIQELTKTVRMKKMVQKNDEIIETEIFLAGGGEPTYNWELFEYIIEKAKNAAYENNYSVRFGIVTNGLIDDHNKISYICNNFTYIQVSVDGATIEQDLHRPTSTGSKSSEVVYSFIDKCLDFGALVAFRMTVSSETVNTLDSSIKFLSEKFPAASHIQVEPLSINSKVEKNLLNAPNPILFIDKYMEGWRLLKNTGIGLFSSVANVFTRRKTDHFCDAITGGTIIINPDGYLSTCYEASTDIENMNSKFFMGKIDNNGELNWKENYSFYKDSQCFYSGCKDCIAWEFCKGGCIASSLRSKENRAFHCAITKGIAKRILNELHSNLNNNIDVNLHVIDKPCKPIDKIVYWLDHENGTKLVLAKV